MVLDGAMGSMIYAHEPTEADYRGARFANHPFDLKNCTEVLVLTQPRMIEDIHRDLPRSGRRHHRDRHVQQQPAVDGRVRARGARLRAEPDRRRDRPPRRRRDHAAHARASRASSPAASGRPRNSSRWASTSRTRPARRDLRPDGGQLHRADPRPDRGRGRHPPARDLVRHAGPEGLPVRHRPGLRGDRRPPAGDDLGHDLRQRPDPLGADGRGVLHLGLALRRPERGPQLRRRGGPDARPAREPGADRPDPRQLLPQRRHARRLRAASWATATTPRPPSASSPATAGSTSSAAAAARPPTGSRRSPEPSRASPRARSPRARRTRASAAPSRWSSAPRPTSS